MDRQFGRKLNTKLTVTARVRRVDPSTTYSYNSGVFIKTSLDYQSDELSGYYMAYAKAKDPITGQPGWGGIWKFDRMNFRTGGFSGGLRLLCYDYVPIKLNGYNTIRVEVEGRVTASISTTGRSVPRPMRPTLQDRSWLQVTYLMGSPVIISQLTDWRFILAALTAL